MRRPLLWLLLVACAPPDRITPAGLPGTGYAPIAVDLEGSGVEGADVLGLRVGGVPAFGLLVDGDTLMATVQGGPPGPAEVVALTAAGEVALGTLVYAAPVDPLLDRLVAWGASLTQGTRDAVPTASAQLAGPAMQVARAAGAWLPLPLLADPLTPMAPSDVGPDCEVPDTVAFILGGIADAVDALRDPVTGTLDLGRARVTPTLPPRNLAIGNARMETQRLGTGLDPVSHLIARLTVAAEGDDLLEPLDATPLELVIAAEPTLLVTFDLYGNDVLRTVLEGGGPEAMPTPEAFAAELALQLDLLEPTGAELVIANLPDATVLPGMQRALDPASRDAVVARIVAYNDAVAAEAARRPWVHVADLYQRMESWRETGLQVGDTRLTLAPLGGLLSLDGVHFTDTGYALAANEVLAVLRRLGVAVDDVDLEAVLAADPRSPDALRSAGVPPACLP